MFAFIAKYHHFDCACMQEVQIQHFWFDLMLSLVSLRYLTQYMLCSFRVRGSSIDKSGTLHVPVTTASFYVLYIDYHQKLKLYLVNMGIFAQTDARIVIGINSISLEYCKTQRHCTCMEARTWKHFEK